MQEDIHRREIHASQGYKDINEEWRLLEELYLSFSPNEHLIHSSKCPYMYRRP